MKPAATANNTSTHKQQPTASKPFRLGSIVRMALLLFLLLIGAVLTLPHALPWLLQQQGIDFDWHNPQWHHDGFSVSNLELTLANADAQPQQIRMDNLRVYWAWQAFPIQRLQVSRLQAHWPLANDASPTEKQSLALPQALLKWLPQQIEVAEIDADVAGLGHVQGSFNVQASAQGVLWQPSFIESALSLKELQGSWLESIPEEFRPTQLSAQITTHPDHRDNQEGQQLLTIDLHSDGPMRLQLNGLLDLQQTPNWQGTLTNTQLLLQLDQYSHPELQAEQLQIRADLNAQADSENFSATLGEHASIEAHNVQLNEFGDAQRILLDLAGLTLQGSSAKPLQAQVSSPFSIQLEGLNFEPLHKQDWQITGLLKGQLPELEISTQLSNQQGLSLSSQARLQDDSAQGHITLDEISFAAGNPLLSTFKDWPEDISLSSGQLSSHIDFNAPYAGPIQLALKLKANTLNGAMDNSRFGNLDVDFSTQLELLPTSDWQATLSDAQFLLSVDSLQDPSLQAKQLQARANFKAQADADKFTITFDNTTHLEAHQLLFTDIGKATQVSIKAPHLEIQGDSTAPYQHNVQGPISAHIEQLSAEQLYTQDWDLNGTLSGALERLKLNGEIKNQQGLTFNSQIQLLEHSVQGHATLKDLFFKAGNPLQKTLKDWPELILFNSGRLNSQANFTLPYKGTAKFSLNGSASGLSGIINRSELKNLNLEFNAQLSGPTLKLSLPSLSVEQLNPGVPVSFIQLSNAHYQAHLDNLLQGVLDWQSIQANLLSGKVWLNPQKLDLQHAQSVLLHVEGLELQELFKVYPAEGLAGNGTIDGQLPIYFDHDNFSISAGQLQARAPGVLQFQSDKIKALGKTNQAMQLVADALEDFHFNLLSSGLSYDQSGKLSLSLRLQGQNPDVEKGRPINLNINLEEDIPALLASIQLSNQVSEIIQKRIRERLEKR